MDISTNLELIFNAELARKLLIKYFSEHGFAENFDRRVFPPLLQGIQNLIPEFNGKLELVPAVIEIDPTNGFARLGWNLFILGNQRMFLGETEHTQLHDLAKQLDSPSGIVAEDNQIFRRGRSARDIVNWVVKVLGRCEGGMLRYADQVVKSPQALGAQSGTFFERPRTIRPEAGRMQ